MNHTNQLIEIISKVPEFVELLYLLQELNLPNHYLAAGAITQCVWNNDLGHDSLYKVKDFDVIYFDNQNTTNEAELEKMINKKTSFNIKVDLTNQANVHKWYGGKFGNQIEPLNCAEDGIKIWLSAFAVGIKKQHNSITVFAPYGLDDLFAKLLKPNKIAMSQQSYLSIIKSIQNRWPEVQVEPW